MIRAVGFAVAVGMIGAAHALPAQDQIVPVEPLLGLQALDQRVLSVGHRLSVAATDLCEGGVPIAGFLIHDLSQYPVSARADVRRVFGFDTAPQVLATAEGGAAAGAGLRIDDAIVAIEGQGVALADDASNSYRRTAAVVDAVEAAVADGDIALSVERSDGAHEISWRAERGCPSRFGTRTGQSLDALADGIEVQVNVALVEFAGDDGELAAVVAHEFAHNLLRHRARLNAAGVNRGFFGQFGRSGRMVRMTEEEADRLSVYLVARAGYPVESLLRFWERFASRRSDFLRAPTHMGSRERLTLFREEIARAKRLQAEGRPLVPAFMESGSLPPLG